VNDRHAIRGFQLDVVVVETKELLDADATNALKRQFRIVRLTHMLGR
jgi:hypothetical protein